MAVFFHTARPSGAPKPTIQQHRMKPDGSKYSTRGLEPDLSLTEANPVGLRAGGCEALPQPLSDFSPAGVTRRPGSVLAAFAGSQGTWTFRVHSHGGSISRLSRVTLNVSMPRVFT